MVELGGRPPAVCAWVLTLAAVAGCTGATVGSGVGDTRLEGAPYYAGRSPSGGLLVAYLPVAYQRGATESPIFEPGEEAGSPVAALLRAMNLHLDSLAESRGMRSLSPLPGTAPDVQFGCDLDPDDECVMAEEEGGFGPPTPSMRLAVGRPSGSWTEAASRELAAVGADAVLVLTLEMGRYWPRQTNWRGSKAVDLGTDRTVALPWLTSLETPLSVVQITGALVGRDGKAIRIGAEGLMARRTSIALTGFGVLALVTDEDVEILLDERLEDRPGRPLVWEAALGALVDQLAYRP